VAFIVTRGAIRRESGVAPFSFSQEVIMPFVIHKRGKSWVVINTNTKKVKGRHPTKKKAEAHRRALYANVPEAGRKRR